MKLQRIQQTREHKKHIQIITTLTYASMITPINSQETSNKHPVNVYLFLFWKSF